MTSWTGFEAAEPELAQRARRLVTATTNCVLGTLQADGSPRLSGIDPFFFEDRLLIGSMPGSRKAADLRRDPRMALHGIPWESRRVKDDVEDPGEGDVKIAGRAVEITDPPEIQRIFGRYWTDRDVDDPPASGDLFVVEPDRVTLISVEADHLVVDSWTAEGGRATVRRT